MARGSAWTASAAVLVGSSLAVTGAPDRFPFYLAAPVLLGTGRAGWPDTVGAVDVLTGLLIAHSSAPPSSR